MKNIEIFVRKNIKELTPYSTARDDCKTKMDIYLDANENPYDNGVNRYPSPFQNELKERIAEISNLKPSQIFIGNGSDEAIDLVYRIFCIPGKSNAVIISPSYGMYSVAAKINDIQVVEHHLDEHFNLDAGELLKKRDEMTRVIFLCSPNNPSGNALDRGEIEKVIKGFEGIVVVDEAYIDFSGEPTLAPLIERYDNLIILRTLSKAWGMAGLRVGIALSNPGIIGYMNRVKYPYNLSVLNQQKALELLDRSFETEEKIAEIKREREYLSSSLKRVPIVSEVFKSDSNFLLVRFEDKDKVFNVLKESGIIVRDRSSLPGCEGCLRITIGTPRENDMLLNLLYTLSGSGYKTERNLPKTTRRCAVVCRKSKETTIEVKVDLDDFAQPQVETGLHFFDHMLEQIGYHANIGLKIRCKGDLERDDHHTVEDVAIAFADALKSALGEKKGIERYGFALPMDEAEALVLIDLGGRIDFQWDVEFSGEKIGDVSSQMFNHFFKSISQHLECNLHIKAKGGNDHHIIEGVFKAFARALKCAVKRDVFNNRIPSSKGIL